LRYRHRFAFAPDQCGQLGHTPNALLRSGQIVMVKVMSSLMTHLVGVLAVVVLIVGILLWKVDRAK